MLAMEISWASLREIRYGKTRPGGGAAAPAEAAGVVSGFYHGHQIAAERDIAAEPPGKIGLRGRPFRVAPPDIVSV
jgi:hypothetical protein